MSDAIKRITDLRDEAVLLLRDISDAFLDFEHGDEEMSDAVLGYLDEASNDANTTQESLQRALDALRRQEREQLKEPENK